MKPNVVKGKLDRSMKWTGTRLVPFTEAESCKCGHPTIWHVLIKEGGQMRVDLPEGVRGCAIPSCDCVVDHDE